MGLAHSQDNQFFKRIAYDAIGKNGINKLDQNYDSSTKSNYSNSIGKIVRCLYSSDEFDYYLKNLPKDIKVKTDSKMASLKKWKSIFYDRELDGEIYWTLCNLDQVLYYEKLEIWEGGSLLRTIVIFRIQGSDKITGIADLQGYYLPQLP